MRNLIMIGVVAIALFGCTPKQQSTDFEPTPSTTPPVETAAQTSTAHRNSVSYLQISKQFLSSCFAVERPRDGKIIFLTALHGIAKLSESQKSSLVLGPEQRKVSRILKSNQLLDLVAFEVDSTEGFAPLSFGHVPEFASVTAESYSKTPFSQNTKYILSKGYTLFLEGGRQYFALNIFYPGGSGCPIFNEKIEVCAMAVRRLTSGNDDIYTGVVDAIPSDMLRQFVASL